MTTSFPFLKIAREYDVPYGSVLRLGDALNKIAWGQDLTDQERVDTAPYSESSPLLNDIVNATLDEKERREHVMGTTPAINRTNPIGAGMQ